MVTRRDQPATKQDLDDLKQELIGKIAGNSSGIRANAEKIDANGRKIEANAEKIDANGRKIDANAEKIDANGRKIEANSAALSRISHQVVDNSEQIKRLVHLSEKFEEYFSEIISALDGLASKSAKLDQESIATNARFDRVERDVDENKADIKRIKTKLAMP